MKSDRGTGILLLALVMVFAASVVRAQFNWTKDIRNPVLSGGGDAAWDAHVFMPMVLFNSDSNRFEMWYGGSDLAWKLPYSFGFASSKDGINWTKYGPPVMTADAGTWEEKKLQVPAVIRENGQYKMWYGGIRAYKGGIGYATSPDGIHWTKHPGNPVLGPGVAGWEIDGPFVCSVVQVPGGGYKMWYAGFEAYPSEITRIGIATSVDGINWNRDTINNPVLDIGAPGQWDYSYVMEPHVLRVDSADYMWYTGVHPDVRSIGMASSVDGGINWKKHTANPVLVPTAGQWDNRYLEAGSVVRMGKTDTLVMWYTGATSLTSSRLWKIGRATSVIVASGVDDHERGIPEGFALGQNHPNPFNPNTVVSYHLPVGSSVKLVVHDILGREVAILVNERKMAGSYEVKFNAGGLASGVYLYRLQAGSYVQSRKMVLTR